MSTRVLMCAPRFLPAITHERSWVPDEALDPELALEEWSLLRALIDARIGRVEEVEPEPWAPAMTFVRDLAFVDGDVVVPLMPVSGRGPFEAPLVHRHLAGVGCELLGSVEPVRFDGGNVLADSHGRLLVGVTTSELSDEFIAAVRFLESSTGRSAYRVPLVGGRFPHVDMAITDLGGRAWLIYPDALAGFDLGDPAWHDLFMGRPVVLADDVDGELLACNLVVAGELVIGPEISSDLRGRLRGHGIDYVAAPLGELRKAGGGAHCLTLELPR